VPNYYPSYTDCCKPGTYQSISVAATTILALTAGGGAALIAAIVGAGPLAPALGVGLCVAGIALCHWWLDIRLLCLGGDRSAIGAIYSVEPFSSGDIADTDYSFNLLLWGFRPQNVLPASFVNNEWSPTAFNQLMTDWPMLPPMVPNIAWGSVANLVTLIAAQPVIAQDVANAGITFDGQGVDAVDEVPFPKGSKQHFVLHCEIEGSGMHDLYVLLIGLLVIFLAALLLSAIPGVSVLLYILAILLFLAGFASIVSNPASPPLTGGWGGTMSPYRPGDNPDQPVDLAYVFGRWVCDSGFRHNGGNELHPVHYMCRIGSMTQGDVAAGNWPAGFDVVQAKLDDFFASINSPAAPSIQQQPENQWQIHPLLDGCEGATPYPQPPPPGIV
jgi:hypothetical protein